MAAEPAGCSVLSSHDDGTRAERDVRAGGVRVLLRAVVVHDNGRQQDHPHVVRLPVLPSAGDRPDARDDTGAARREEAALRRVP